MFTGSLQKNHFLQKEENEKRHAGHHLNNFLFGFSKIDLGRLNAIGLMKRFDTKFIFHTDKLPVVLERLYPDYAALEINNKRLLQYQNLYFDTPDYFFYHQHHNRKSNWWRERSAKAGCTQQCPSWSRAASPTRGTRQSNLTCNGSTQWTVQQRRSSPHNPIIPFHSSSKTAICEK